MPVAAAPTINRAEALPRPKAIGLQFDGDIAFQEWAEIGRCLAQLASGSAWSIGDWLIFGEHAFGRRYREALDDTHLQYKTLRTYAYVARRFEASRRHAELSFQHHGEVAALCKDEQDHWLRRAGDEHWSRNELRRRLASRRALGRPDQADHVAVVNIRVPSDRERLWRAAASAADQELLPWLCHVVDAAAEAELSPADPGAPTGVRRGPKAVALAD
jgi:hypothetical protein